MNILLGVTGSVATTLVKKMADALAKLPLGNVNVQIVATKSGKYFMPSNLNPDLTDPNYYKVWTDEDEWQTIKMVPNPYGVERPEAVKTWSKKGDPVVHIDLRKWAGALVIAPCSANTMAKIAHGLSDNLLTSIVRAWDPTRPIIIAPAMNTYMWHNPVTSRHLEMLRDTINKVIQPQDKVLACGDEGKGAMANIENIVDSLEKCLQWFNPLEHYSGVPIGNHPGAFGFKRKHSHHTGVDLYTHDNAQVFAVESGTVINREPFTGPQDNSPWWENTDCMLIEGASGVVCYGEITPLFEPGRQVHRGQQIGKVKRVLPIGKERPDIPGHSTSMLHLELYNRDRRQASTSWALDKPKHEYLLDPTPWLLGMKMFNKTLEMK